MFCGTSLLGEQCFIEPWLAEENNTKNQRKTWCSLIRANLNLEILHDIQTMLYHGTLTEKAMPSKLFLLS